MLEVCVDSLESALAAAKGGAGRLELCSALSVAGLTPTAGLLKVVKQGVVLPVFCMIRCRNGNFTYSEQELEVMLADLHVLKNCGADGFVFGALNSDGTVNCEMCRTIVQAAAPLPCTFHRAIDDCTNWKEAIDHIVDLGFQRILTSGQKETTLQGLDTITEMIKHADNKISIMPGSGICRENVNQIQQQTKCTEIHASCSKQKVKNNDIKQSTVDPSIIKVTCSDKVHLLAQQLQYE